MVAGPVKRSVTVASSKHVNRNGQKLMRGSCTAHLGSDGAEAYPHLGTVEGAKGRW